MALNPTGTKVSFDGEWIFFPNADSFGNDIGQSTGLNSTNAFKQQRAHADGLTNPRCVAFTTSGWFKFRILPRERWGSFNGNGHGLWVRRSAIDALEWQFFPGMDSPGNDIEQAREYAGNNAQLMAYVTSRYPHECVAFNTNGWIKKVVLPRDTWAEMNGWTDSKHQGLWVKKAALESTDWLFIQGVDSYGNDIRQQPGTAEEIRKAAEGYQENCVAFTTTGWIKFKLNPRATWTKWTTDPNQGMYIKRSALERLDWRFIPGVDSPGSDLEHAAQYADDASDLFHYVSNLPGCHAFNTNGWFKTALNPFVSFDRSPFRGLYVKNDQPDLQQKIDAFLQSSPDYKTWVIV